MVRRYYDLPSLTALAVFEASARHLSFRLAAAELNVTPGAVSRQVKAVEDELGVLLFERAPAGVALTEAGESLYGALAGAFSGIAECAGAIRRGGCAPSVTLACTDAFATMWLVPRMGGFWSRFPDVSVHHLISDDPRDFRRGEVDLRIRYGSGSWPDETAELLFDETIYPVCSADFAASHPGAGPADLAALPLLHVNWVDPEWPGWDEVLRRSGVPHRPLRGRRFGKFSVALQAAQADQGVAVGWHRLVRGALADGRLARFTTLELPAPGGYYLTWNEKKPLSRAAQTLRAWLKETAAAEN